MKRSLKNNPFVANPLLRKMEKLNRREDKILIRTWSSKTGERRELNPRVEDPQTSALIHLATSAP